MSKWRNTCPDALLTRIGQGYDAQLYLLRQTGPTGFLLKEHDSDTKFKVLLGLKHTCDCSLFLKDKELCKHIIWILTRKFRVAKDNPLVYQLGLNERELNGLIYAPKQSVKKVINKAASAGHERVIEKKKEIQSDDVCPICQEEIYNSKRSLIHCKFGCGNSIHVSCMKIWADHQLKSLNDDIIKCPLCRTEFSSHHNIVKEYARAKAKEKGKQKSHFCNSCKSKLTLHQFYRCSVCKNVFLCSSCFQTNYHCDHSFECRSSTHEKWSTAIRHAISLTPNVSRYDSNNCISPVEQNRTGDKNKYVERIHSRVIKSVNTNSLPDLSLGISGINLHVQQNLSANIKKTKSNICFPPLPNHNHGNSDSPKIHGKVRSKNYMLRKEHSLPVEGISDIISVSSLQQLRGNDMLSD